jgi:phenylalanyl-tRNA synthetase beta chain
MLLPLAWLKKLVPKLPQTQKLVDALMMHGLEVESIIDRRAQFEKVVVGEIVHIKPHPNADKLRLADVIVSVDRSSSARQQIVCGAPNIAVGQKVAVALVGARLPKMTIEPREIRGIKSNGMICAEDELGLGTSHAGVMVLDSKLKVGTPFAKAMGFDEVVLDIATPANRADLMSVRGLARETAAILGQVAKMPTQKLKELKLPARKFLTVSVTNPKLVPVYSARVMKGVQMGDSPAWLQNWLLAAGMRPINAVVDATNFIMLEYGQPLHAFDAAKIKGGKIMVRSAKAGEMLMTLDGVHRKLDPSMLVIADASGPIALAGVMGGRETEVTNSTTDIILEAAIFDPVSIRKTSRQLGLISEASKRFEKGLWPQVPEQASVAAAALITELTGGAAAKGSIHVAKLVAKIKPIVFDPNLVSERLGMAVPVAQIKSILTRLGFTVKGAKRWSVTVPEWRLDVSLPEDLVDEVGRMIGYEKLPSAWPTTPSVPGPMPEMVKLKDDVRQYFAGQNFVEVITHAYYGSREASVVQGKHIEVANPLDKTQQYLRRSLIPSIRKILGAAADAGENARVFEIGRVFESPSEQPWKLAFGVAVKSDHAHTAVELVTGMLDALGMNDQKHTITKEKGRTIVMAETPLHPTLIKFKTAGKYPALKRDISFWLPEGKEASIGRAVADTRIPHVTSLSLKDKFSQDGRMSFTITLTFQADDKALQKTDVDAMEKQVKDALVKLGATIR